MVFAHSLAPCSGRPAAVRPRGPALEPPPEAAGRRLASRAPRPITGDPTRGRSRPHGPREPNTVESLRSLVRYPRHWTAVRALPARHRLVVPVPTVNRRPRVTPWWNECVRHRDHAQRDGQQTARCVAASAARWMTRMMSGAIRAIAAHSLTATIFAGDLLITGATAGFPRDSTGQSSVRSNSPKSPAGGWGRCVRRSPSRRRDDKQQPHCCFVSGLSRVPAAGPVPGPAALLA